MTRQGGRITGKEEPILRKWIVLFAGISLFLLLTTAPALAQTYTFNEIRASLDIPDEYDLVITPYNLISNTDWIAEQGVDYDTMYNMFDVEGILLEAIDTDTGRTFVLTALNDLDAQTYFDLNNQDEDMRKEFRTSHTNGTGYSILGYDYSSAKWANYGKTTLRFLQTQYTLRQDGQLVCSGYQRRTIRNGYTITLDMQVRGRSAKEADNTALEKIMKSFTFTEILPMPDLPIKLTFTAAPPSETNSESFTIKGTTAKKATVTVTVFSLANRDGQTYTTTASSGGSFTQKVDLPTQGVYAVTVSASAEGAISAQRTFSVTYQKGILPVDVTVSPGSSLGDSTTISGTTIAGAKIQLSISGPITYSKTVTGEAFSFKVDTSAEGTYQFVLSVTKKDLDSRVFTYTASRTYTDAEREEKIKASAKKITYANLSKNENQGKTVVETGYLTGASLSINEWVVTLAMTKSGTNYKDIVYLICQDEPAFSEGAFVKIYGTISGTYAVQTEDGYIKNYPRINVQLMELGN